MNLSVIVTSYRCAPYIQQALESLFQTAPEGTDIIVVDDGSDDGSADIAKRVGAAWPGSFRLLQHPGGGNRGPGASRNLGISAATGEWVAFLDGDDYFLPGRFDADAVMTAADASLDGIAGVTRMDVQETAGSICRVGAGRIALPTEASGDGILRSLLQEKFWHANALTVRRSAIVKAEGFAEHLKTSEDCFLWFKLAASGKIVVSRCAEPVAVYRRRPGSTLCIGHESQAFLLQAMAEAWTWARKRALPSGMCAILGQGARDYFVKVAGTALIRHRRAEALELLRRLIKASGGRLLLQPRAAWLGLRIAMACLVSEGLASRMARRAAKGAFDAVYDRPLQRPGEREQHALREMHDAFLSLPEVSTEKCLPTEAAWRGNMNRLRHLVLTGNPREFLRWSVIYNSMFIRSVEYVRGELGYLKSRPDWPSRWRGAIRECPAGRPWPCTFRPSSSGNLIHHAYHLAVFEELAGMPVHEMESVVEFGGGYGSLCRLFHVLGFRGRYIIFDLPHFSLLQRYYLKTAGVPVRDEAEALRATEGVWCLSDPERLRQALHELPPGVKKMFLATWSISEVPVGLREQVLPLVSGFQAFLIAFQERFGEVDNMAYFNEWTQRMPGIRWQRRKISHLPADWYLAGTR